MSLPTTNEAIINTGAARIAINPGTGDVTSGSVTQARQNIERLLEDAGFAEGACGVEEQPESHHRGRYSFIIRHGEAKAIVDMPGLPLDQVRYTGARGQDIWDFPRFYVDGGSWVWKFGISILQSALSPHPQDEEDGA